MLHPEIGRKPALECLRIVPRRQPELKRTRDEILHLLMIVDARRIRQTIPRGEILLWCMILLTVRPYKRENLPTHLLLTHPISLPAL